MTREELLKLHNELTTAACELMQAKNSDYNANDDPFGNLSACEIIGVPPLKGVLVRMLDKFKRLESFASGKDMQVSDERLTDTVVDMINYAVIFAAMASGRGNYMDAIWPLFVNNGGDKMKFCNETPGKGGHPRNFCIKCGDDNNRALYVNGDEGARLAAYYCFDCAKTNEWRPTEIKNDDAESLTPKPFKRSMQYCDDHDSRNNIYV